jgi:polyferredoxin
MDAPSTSSGHPPAGSGPWIAAAPVTASPIQRILRSDAPWMLARLAALAALAAVFALVRGRWGIEGVAAPDPLMYTNLGNLLFWVALMMGLPFIAHAGGRVFCAACPLGAMNEWVARRGARRPFPRALRNDSLKVLLLLLTVGLLGLSRIHHWPGATAWYIALWLALAVVLGLAFRGRALCSFACPLGGMLGLYSRVAPLEAGVAEQATCRACPGRECIKGRESWTTLALGRWSAAFRFRRAGCPVNLTPWDIHGSGRCLLCGNCLRACPYGNAVLRTRTPVSSLWRESFPRFTETATAAALLGFLFLSFARFWPGLTGALSLPGRLLSPLVGVAASRLIYIIGGGFLIPLLLMALPALAARWRLDASAAGTPPPPGASRWGLGVWRREESPDPEPLEGVEGEEGRVVRVDSVPGLMAVFLPAYVPVLLAGHMLLAAVKLNAKAAYLALAFADPVGMRSYMAVEEYGLIPRPGLLFPIAPLKWTLLVIFALAVALGVGTALAIARREKLPAAPVTAALLAAAAAVGGGFLKWLF